MILILTNQAVFVTLSVVTIPPLAQRIFILKLNHADVIGDQSDAVTQNAWFRCALCDAISGEISILIQTESWRRFPVPRICRWKSTNILGQNVLVRNLQHIMNLYMGNPSIHFDNSNRPSDRSYSKIYSCHYSSPCHK